jgi:hypothetical protein
MSESLRHGQWSLSLRVVADASVCQHYVGRSVDAACVVVPNVLDKWRFYALAGKREGLINGVFV